MNGSAPSRIETPRTTPRSFCAVLAAFVAPPVLCRLWLVFLPQHRDGSERIGELLIENLRGSMEDVAVAALLAVLVMGARSTTFRRVWFFVALLFWNVLYYGQYEHVADLGTSLHYLELRYALSGAFLAGSASAILAPGLCAVLALIMFLSTAVVVPPYLHPRRFTTAVLFAVVLLFALALWPVRIEQRLWTQRNLILENVQSIREGASGLQLAAQTAESKTVIARLQNTPQDLPSRFPLPRTKQNVLLLILEGIPGSALDPIARHHHLPEGGSMPFLSSLASRGMLYPNFFTQDRHTDRGEFGILCGQYSNAYGMPQMSEYASCGGAVCLPQVLKERGYSTHYLQAAPLEFMLKSEFMPAAGFAESHGTDWFTEAHISNGWGVDDRSLFERGAAEIQKLDAKGAPWFLAMLTVGTHHPYLVTDEYAAEFPDRLTASLKYLDAALESLFTELDRTAALRNTLVVITSDESHGSSNPDPALSLLSYNWGFLLVLPASAPGAEVVPRIVADPYLQIDIPPSLTDYLGFDGDRRRFIGSSFFREADPTRPLYFANHLGSRVFLAHNQAITISSLDGVKRTTLGYTYPDIFSTSAAKLPDLPDRESVFQAMREFTRSTCARSDERRVTLFPAQKRRFDGINVSGMRLIGGQHLRIPPRSHVRIVMDFTYHRANGVDPALLHLQLTQVEKVLNDLQLILPTGGDTRFTYSLTNTEELGLFNVNVYLHGLAQHDDWDVREATVSYSPATSADIPGLTYTLAGSSQRSPIWNSDSFPAAACVTEHRRISKCPQQFIVQSPLFNLPANARLTLRSSLRALHGHPRVFLEISSADGASVRYRSPITELTEGTFQELEISGPVRQTLEPLQFRLAWIPVGEEDEAEYEGSSIEISPTS